MSLYSRGHPVPRTIVSGSRCRAVDGGAGSGRPRRHSASRASAGLARGHAAPTPGSVSRFYEFYVSTKSPLAAEVLARIGKLYEIEAEIRGSPAEQRRAVRQQRSRPIVEALHAWFQEQLPRLSGASPLAAAIRYALRHWSGLVVFLDDGRLEMDTNVVERGMKGVAVARKNALFAGSDGAAEHWAIALTLISTAKLNGVEPLAWLTDVLERLVSGGTKAHELEQLLPWNWRPPGATDMAKAA